MAPTDQCLRSAMRYCPMKTEFASATPGRDFSSNSDEMKTRTKRFGLRVIRLVESLPKSRVADVLGRQLLRSGTSVGANYRASCRARSRAEFQAKLGIVE